MPYLRFWKSIVWAGLLFGSCLAATSGLAADFSSELPPADPDAMTVEAVPFGHAELDQLKSEGVAYLDSPTGQLRIDLVAVHNSNLGERIDVSVDGLPGSFTRIGNGFFASLPSRYGSMRLENNGNSTRLIDEQVLDQRNLRQLKDFRTPVLQ